MDIASQLSDIKQSLNGLHQRSGASRPSNYAQAILLRACAEMASKAGNHALAASLVAKAAVEPAKTTVAGWAKELTESAAGQLLLMATARSAFATILARSHQVGVLGKTQQAVTVLAPPPRAAIVDEGAAIPVIAGSLSSLPVSPKKVAGITSYTSEQSKRSSIVSVARQLLTESLGKGLDALAFSDQGPFGLLQSVTPTAPGATPLDDVKALLDDLDEPSPDVVFVMSVSRLPVFLEAAGPSFPYAAVPSSVLADELIAVDPAGLAAAVSGGEIDVSLDSTLHMSDQPTAIIQGSPTRSLFQTDSYAMRALMDMAWAKRAGSVAFVDAVTW